MENIYKYLKSSTSIQKTDIVTFHEKRNQSQRRHNLAACKGQVFLPNSDWILDQCILPTAMNNHDHNPHNSIQFTQTISEINRFRPISEMGRIQNHHNRSLSRKIPAFPVFFSYPVLIADRKFCHLDPKNVAPKIAI